ncbi:unnamed protein product [Polarella glacialis]|uniref:Uncharacterized protein n=1 Tax=Polarella glacialis TaxID=89957 RepID=A0A813KG12_POLGL|nr:unnamed protein product [Polarella glacialis]
MVRRQPWAMFWSWRGGSVGRPGDLLLWILAAAPACVLGAWLAERWRRHRRVSGLETAPEPVTSPSEPEQRPLTSQELPHLSNLLLSQGLQHVLSALSPSDALVALPTASRALAAAVREELPDLVSSGFLWPSSAQAAELTTSSRARRLEHFFLRSLREDWGIRALEAECCCCCCWLNR